MAYDYGYYSGGDGGILARGIYKLEEIGVADVILPFLLVFTIVFAILQKTKILGVEQHDGKSPKKNFNGIIALVMALAVVIPHVIGAYPSPERDVVNIINSALPNVSIILIAVVMMLLIIGVFGGEVNIAGSSLSGIAVMFAVAATVFVFGSAAHWWELPSWLGIALDSDTQALVVIILVFAILIWFITKDNTPKNKKPYNLFDEFGKVMGYKGSGEK